MEGSQERGDVEPSADEAEQTLILELGRALHLFGASAPRSEGSMTLLANRFGVPGQFFATPTAIFAAFGPQGRQRTTLMRVQPGRVDLGMREWTDELIQDVLERRIDARAALARLEALLALPRRPHPALAVLCFGSSSMCAARFFGGGVRELLVAFALGATTGLLSLVAARTVGVRRAFEPLAAFVVAALAMLAAHWIAPLSTYTAIVSGLIVLLPGLSLTTAMSELAAQHLASGTARLMGSALTFLSLAFGVALGRQVAGLLPPRDVTADLAVLPPWTVVPALIVAPLCFAFLLRARTGDYAWIVAVSVAAFLGARVGAEWFGASIGAALGAFVAGAMSNGISRAFRRSAAVTVVPGILMLVPGSIGFQSLSSLLSRDVVSGVETAFTMVLVAISLVSGLLIANVVVRPRAFEHEAP